MLTQAVVAAVVLRVFASGRQRNGGACLSINCDQNIEELSCQPVEIDRPLHQKQSITKVGGSGSYHQRTRKAARTPKLGDAPPSRCRPFQKCNRGHSRDAMTNTKIIPFCTS